MNILEQISPLALVDLLMISRGSMIEVRCGFLSSTKASNGMMEGLTNSAVSPSGHDRSQPFDYIPALDYSPHILDATREKL